MKDKYSKTIIVNLLAGPGVGKSTTAAGVFYWLKSKNVNAEIAPEYAKEVVWEENYKQLINQVAVLGHQHHRIFRLLDKVDVIITDSPILLVNAYTDNEDVKKLALSEFNKFNNLNILLMRSKEYNPKGRMQTEQQAIEKDNEILNILKENNVPYLEYDTQWSEIEKIGELILEKIKQNE